VKKKIKFLVLLTLLGLVLVLAFLLPKKSQPEVVPEISPQPLAEEIGKVSLVLDFGEGEVASFSGISAKTAFEALESVSQSEDWLLETKQYDFGILVESINGKKNTEEKAWLFYVNGKMADKAADKFEVSDGDMIKWRYEEPQF